MATIKSKDLANMIGVSTETPFNTAGICRRLVEGIDWFYDKTPDFHYPVFMTHGADDQIVDPKDTREFFHSSILCIIISIPQLFPA